MLAAAAIIVLVTGIAHSYLGERFILSRLQHHSLPHLFGSDDFTRRTLRFAWHLTTLAWWGIAALLLTHFSSTQVSLQIVSVVFVLSGLLSLLSSKGRHLSWIAFLAVAALCWIASTGYGS